MTCKPKPFYRRTHTRKSRLARCKLTLLSLSILISSLVGGRSPSWAQAEEVQAQRTQAEGVQAEGTNAGEAPIIVDPSLGDERSRLSNDNQSNRINITGGAHRGENLFHSFERFNIPSRQQAVYFMPKDSIENVLTRVVGSDPSNILGTLGVEGSANLWFINPNGIVFGESAKLDISGSFYATTGAAIPTGAGDFSAIPSQNEQLLFTSPEASFANYLTGDSGTIVVRGSLIDADAVADEGTTLTLAGSSVSLERKLSLDENRSLSVVAYNNIETNTITTPGTDVSLLAENGDITVGRINVNADRANAGNIDITAAGNVETNVISARSTSTGSNAGLGGNVTIETTGGGSILNRGGINVESRVSNNRDAIENDSNISLDASDGGSIRLITQAGGDIVNEGALNTRSRSANGNTGEGGIITIATEDSGNIINAGVLRSQSDSGTGNTGSGGNIEISAAQGNILNQDALRASSDTEGGNTGSGGNITLSANSGSITNEQDLAAQSTTEDGNAGSGGNITLSATGDILNLGLLNTYSFSEAGRSRNGGDILIESTGGGNVTNLGTFRSQSASDESIARNGGSITISAVADGTITNRGALNAQSLSNSNLSGGAGAGGNITLTTENGDIVSAPSNATANTVRNGGSLNARSVTRSGDAGNGGTVEVTSTGGDIRLNAYLDSKSYSLNGISRNGGDILVSAEAGSITGSAANSAQTNIVTSAVSTEFPDSGTNTDTPANANTLEERARNRQSGNVTLTAGEQISGFNVFTLANQGASGDVNIVGTGDLQIEDIEVITNRDVVIGSFDFDENRLFPANSAGSVTDTNIPVTVNIPETGTPGDVSIRSDGNLSATNLFVSNNANSQNPVGAGEIFLSSEGVVTLTNSQLITNSEGAGNAGTITIESSETVILDNTELFTGTAGVGLAGEIQVVVADYLLLRNGSLLSADAKENGNGGRIFIEAGRVIATPNGNNDIVTNANYGNGGGIFSPEATLYGFEQQTGSTTAQLRSRRSNDISARSEFGQAGSITVNGITETPNQIESEELDDSFSTPEQLISNSCISPNSSVAGSFTIPGTGDLPPTPEDSTASVYSLGDVQTLAADSSAVDSTGTGASDAKPAWQLGDPIIEPESIAKLADGRIAFGQRCSAL